MIEPVALPPLLIAVAVTLIVASVWVEVSVPGGKEPKSALQMSPPLCCIAALPEVEFTSQVMDTDDALDTSTSTSVTTGRHRPTS